MPGLFLLKTLIVVTPVLLALEGVAVAIRAWLAPSDPALGEQD
jgi:TRAP-type mannitol/chloroaromatic compound transport system permease small subunit